MLQFLTSIVWSEYKKRLFITMRQLCFLVVVMAIAFFFAAMWPAMNFMFTATFQNAQYDIKVNGPLTAQDLNSIKKVLGSNIRSMTGLYAGSVERIHANNKVIELNLINYYYQPSANSHVPLTIFSDGLLLQGSMKKEDAWGIDIMSSKRLGLDIDDRISFDQSVVDSSGKVHKLHQSGIIKAIYAPTSEVSGIISPADSKTTGLLSTDGVIYTDFFIGLQNISPSEGEMLIRSIPKSNEWLIESVPAAYARGKARVEQTLNRNIRYSTIWAALLIYAIFLLREQFSRMERRKKNIAILFSLGLSEHNMIRMFALEQVVLNLFTGLFGIALGLFIVQDNLGLYVPNETVISMSIFISGIIILCLALTIVQTVYRLRRIDVARLLTIE